VDVDLYAWLSFFKLFSETNTEERIRATLDRRNTEAARRRRPC